MGCCQNNKVMVVLRTSETAKLPTKADGDMCYDIYANEDAVVEYGKITTIKTGLKIAPPEGYHYSVRDRSGLAAKHGLHVLAGQIDNSYRGELLVCMTKLKLETEFETLLDAEDDRECVMVPYNIKAGDKIAQFKLEKDVTVTIVEATSIEELGLTQRGEKGFGSSGNV